MEYDEIEQKLIEKAFEIVFMEYPHLKQENEEDIIVAIRAHHDKYNMNANDTKIAYRIFEKNGLWHDGRTPIEIHEKQELENKLKQNIKYKELKDKHVSRLKELKGTIDQKIKELEDKPKEVSEKYLKKAQELKERARKRITEKTLEIEQELKQLSDELTNEFNQAKKVIFNDLNDDLKQLQREENIEIDEIVAQFEELEQIKEEYMDAQGIYERDVKPIEVAQEHAEASLFDLTIRDLKELADQKGIEYPQRILKADLIELVK